MATRISIADFRKRFPVNQSQQSLGTGLYSSMIQTQDLQQQAEVVLRITMMGTDSRQRSPKAAPDRMTGIRHSNLVTPIEVLMVDADPTDPRSLPMEVMVFLPNQGESLDSYLKGNVSMEDRAKVVNGILSGLEALHNQGIIHGNLKPSNVLVQRLPQAALCDFGYSERFDYRNAVLQWTTEQLAYVAPEQLAGRALTPNVDFWALGLLAYKIFMGRYLFGSSFSNNTELVAHIDAADFPKDISQLPWRVQNLVLACLNRDPQQRPSTVAQLREILAGKIRWEGGKAVPVVQQAPPPQDISCRSCGHPNSPNAANCSHCGKALRGPSFLHRYRSSNSLAIWTLIWFAMFMLPIGFFYYGLYKVERFGDENQTTWDKVQEVIEWWQKIAPDEQHRSYSNRSSSELSPEEKAAVLIAVAFACYFFVFGCLWMLFQILWTWRVSNNLTALGASNRKYHPALILLSVGIMFAGALGMLAFPPIALLAFPVATIFPLLTLQEVWRGSNPTYLQTDGGWRNGKGSFLIFSWWLLSLVFPILLILPLLPVEFFLKMGFPWHTSLEWFYVTIGILVLYCVMYALMLMRVNFRQARKYAAWTR